MTGGGPLDFLEWSPLTSYLCKGSQFSDSCTGFLMNSSSPTSNDDFRRSGLRRGGSDVFCIEERTVPCDLAVLFAVDDNGLLFAICRGGPEGASLEGGLGEYEGGGLDIGAGGVLSRVMGGRPGLEKSIVLGLSMVKS